MTQFTPLAPSAADPKLSGAAVYSEITAARSGEGWVLDCTARHVLDGDRADRLAVATPAGVFAVGAEQVSAHRVPIFDPVLHVSEVTFDGVRVGHGDRVAGSDTQRTQRAKDVALTGMALTMVGACQRILNMALEHVGSRQQFGVGIGSFQAVQHKAADMRVAIERARALSYFAALTISADDPRRRLAAAMARRRQGSASHWCSNTASSSSGRWASPGRTTCSSRSSGPRPAN